MRPILLLAALAAPAPLRAQQSAFDLSGPTLAAAVTRNGATLPLPAVPALRPGDRLSITADLPEDQSTRYRLVVAFLRGATNPPPRNWFFESRTWKRDARQGGALSVTVPEGAEQAVAFLAPEAGGGLSSVVNAVRGRPGVFVRAATDLHLASQDRARLEAFVEGIARADEQSPERLATTSAALAQSLAIRLNTECLSRPRALQAACLTQNRETLVLQAGRGATLAETLSGAPADLAFRIAATREAGAGYYSPYIGLARDLARLFGLFGTPQYQYLPVLAVGKDDALRLRLHTPPSFQNPRSVLVAPLPPVGPAAPPTLRATGPGRCLARANAVLAVESAHLLHATGYAQDLALSVEANGRTTRVPLTPDAARGGLVPAALPAELRQVGPASAAITGRWGFEPFTGPSFTVGAGAGGWSPEPGASVVVGRDHPLVLRGGFAGCVDAVALRDAAGAITDLRWSAAADDALAITLPLTRARPGAFTLLVTEAGAARPTEIALAARAEPSRIETLTLHEADAGAALAGTRLDQVAELRVGDARFTPGALTREPGGDRLTLSATDAPPAWRTGETVEAEARLRDGRTVRLRTEVAPPRPRAELVSQDVELPPTGRARWSLPEGVVPIDGRLTLSIRLPADGPGPDDALELATPTARTRLTPGNGLRRASGGIAVAAIQPQQAFGPDAAGPLSFRIVRNGIAGEWQHLGHIVRLPQLETLSCPPAAECTLTGRDLFTLTAISDTPTFERATPIPPGFVARRLPVPRARARTLHVKLLDAPDEVARVEMAD